MPNCYPTFETSHGLGPSIILCEGAPLTLFVTDVPTNSFFRFFRVPSGGSATQLFATDPSLAQITTTEHSLNDVFYAEVIYAQNGITSTTLTSSITIDYFPSPTGLALTSNLENRFYCADTVVEITATGADFYLFYLDGIAQGASSTLETIIPDLLRGDTVITVEGYNLFGCSNSVSITLREIDLSPGTISESQIIQLDELPEPLLNQSHASLGTNTFDTITTGIYQWQSSFDGIEWFDVLDANEADFTPSLITTNTFLDAVRKAVSWEIFALLLQMRF